MARRERIFRDPEFTVFPGRHEDGSAVSPRQTFTFAPERYQRLLANPFLAFALGFGWIILLCA